MEKKDFHIIWCRVSTFCGNPTDWLQGFEEEHSFSNFSGWDHVDYRSVVAAIPYANAAEQSRLIEQATSIFAHQSPAIPICSCSIVYAKHPHLKGEAFDSAGCVDFRFSFLEQ
jgi:hypothetical protein